MTPAEYRDLLDEVVPDTRTELVPLSRAGGRVLATPIHAAEPLPRFDNSAVDGFAVTAEVAARLRFGPVRVKIALEVAAGAEPGPPLDGITAHQIMTGAPVSPTAAAVIKVEETSGFAAPGEWVTIDPTPATVTNIRRQGEDIARRQLILEAGTQLTPAKLAVLAANGCANVSVRQRIRTLVVATGDELVHSGTVPSAGQIFESNGSMLAALLAEAGCDVQAVEIVRDTPGELEGVVAAHAGTIDLVLTSGGISAGTHESVRTAIGTNASLLRLDMKPGGPQGFGTLAGRPVICFPGNPVSSFTSFVALLEPILRTRHGLPARPIVAVDLKDAAPPLRGRHVFHMARLVEPALATPVAAGRSGSMAALAFADVLVSVPPDDTESGGFNAWILRPPTDRRTAQK